MRYLPSLVTVRDIQPRTSQAEHSSETIEQLAREILATGALARPLVVRQTGLESFELLDGELGFHAAARARELDPVNAEAVLAFISTRQNEAPLHRQLELLAGGSRSVTATVPSAGADVSAVLTRLEQVVSRQFRQFEEHQRQENEAFRVSNLELAKRIPQPPETLRLLNGEDDDMLLRYLKATGQKGDRILASVQEARPFRSLQEVPKRKVGISADRLLKMTDLIEGHVALSDAAIRKAKKRETAGV